MRARPTFDPDVTQEVKEHLLRREAKKAGNAGVPPAPHRHATPPRTRSPPSGDSTEGKDADAEKQKKKQPAAALPKTKPVFP